jgi:hypothetical protein
MAVFCTMRMAFGHPYSHCEIGWRLLVYRHQWVPRPGMVVFFTKRMTFGHPYSHREVVWRLFWYSNVNNLQSMISWTYSFWCDLRGEVHYSNNIKALMFYNLVKHVKVSCLMRLYLRNGLCTKSTKSALGSYSRQYKLYRLPCFCCLPFDPLDLFLKTDG